MILNDFIKTAAGSDLLLLQDSRGNELYRGYIGCLEYQDIDRGRKVKEHGISVETYTQKTMEKGAAKWKRRQDKVPEGSTGMYKYADLQVMVFIRVILEG